MTIKILHSPHGINVYDAGRAFAGNITKQRMDSPERVALALQHILEGLGIDAVVEAETPAGASER